MKAIRSDGSQLTSTAAKSTRAVRIVSAVTSANCRAELTSSPLSVSSVPSSVISSMMSYSSSSVTDTSGSPFVSFAACFPKAVRMAVAGPKMDIKKHSDPAVDKASRSLYFFAMLFGSISPIKKIAMVIIIVLIVTAETPHLRVTNIVTSDAITICTIFVPISIVVIALSKLSNTRRAFLALPSPRSRRDFSLTRETDANAPSANAKYAARNMRIIIIAKNDRLPSSI